jgi:lipoate-protein ligase A
VGLDEVTDEDVTELLDSHGQQLYNEDLEEQAKEIRQQKEEKKEKYEESPLKCMKTSALQCVLSAMDTLMMTL